MSKNRVVLTLLIVASLIVIVRGWVRHAPELTRTVNGTIASIDRVTRRGVLLVDSGSETSEEMVSYISEQCVVTVDDNPATLENVRVGDRATVTVQVRHEAGIGPTRDREMEVVGIQINRSDAG